VFVQNISFVPDVCCKCFDSDVCICFLMGMLVYVSLICCNNMFHMFHLFQMYVANVLFGCCICYNDHVTSICFKCFICFSRMLQLFHFEYCKSRSQCRLFSEEERASAGVMAASAVS
jgi:hypothetical protein